MKTNQIAHYFSSKHKFMSNELEDAYYDSMLRYSLQHLTLLGDITYETTMEALQKSLRICYLAGINSKHHFKQIYLFDLKTGTLNIDWRMSKIGFNLLVIQIPFVSEKLALWLWKLSANEK